MAELIVLGFDSRRQAEQVWELGRRLSRQGLVDLADRAVAWREDSGAVHVRHGARRIRSAAVGGAACGATVGAVFLAPVVGLAIGAGGGALAGRLLMAQAMDTGMIRRIAGHLQPGRAAVFALVRESRPAAIVALREHHPMVIKTSLPREREEALARALRFQSSPA
ncbi:hypothetical protein BBK14_07635 [Parafrankia soli]|uniref:DUF1269 domain-containing protein n=1 Tax=Parafrankia soli TaxID=2599596 RepID=A0A1S1PHG2_9ACTN|nr:DUF1269 domain-containing protein [Parafrankia soli]OHV21150.1 hypothetical protein BBK14_07635 [Parafrankia soli]